MTQHRTRRYEARRLLFYAMAIAVLVIAAYHQAPANGFHYDDIPNIVERGALHPVVLNFSELTNSLTDGLMFTRPLPNLSFAIDWWRGDGSPVPFQKTNIAIHAANAVLVMLVILQLVPMRTRYKTTALTFAFLGAAAWALHPIQVQAVTYIVQRMAALSAFFMLLTVLFFLVGRRTGGKAWPWFILMMISALLGLGSKENAAILPLLLLAAEYGVVRTQGRLFQGWFDYLLLGTPLLVGALVLLDLMFSGPLSDWLARGYAARDFTLSERLLTQPRVIAFHIYQTLLPMPSQFSLLHHIPKSTGLLSPPFTGMAILLVLLWITAGLLCFRKPRQKTAGFLILWVPTTLLIESTFIPLEMIYEHRMYFPTIGLFGLLTIGTKQIWDAATQQRTIFLSVATIYLCTLFTATYLRVPEWRTDESLYTKAITVSPTSVIAQYNLANTLRENGQSKEAIEGYLRALQLPETNAVKVASIHNNLGVAYGALGDAGRSHEHYLRALEINPSSMHAHFNVGDSLRSLGRSSDAVHYYRQAITLAPRGDPEMAAVFHNLGLALVDQSLFRAAIPEFENALRIAPQRASSGLQLANALARSGATEKALDIYHQLIAEDNANIEAHAGLSETLFTQGRKAQATDVLRKAIALQPNSPTLHNRLGRLLALMGQDAAAKGAFRRALQLQSDYVDALNNLAGSMIAEKNLSSARHYLEKVLEHDPEHPQAKNNLRSLLQTLKQ